MTPVSLALAAPGLTLQQAQAQALRIVNRSGSSFTLAMKLMSKRKRQAMFAVYAFARAVDDIADGDAPAKEKQMQLGDWRQEIEQVYTGTPQTVIGLALADAIAAFALPKQEFLLLIEGMAMDAEPIVAPPMQTLLDYTRRAAGTVGMLSMPIFGAPPGPVSDRFALALADGLQLTNILRDVREDAGVGRLYLPRELLAEQGLAGQPPLAVAESPAVIQVAEALGRVARQRFQDARAEMPKLERGHIRPALMMMGVYEGYLQKLAQSDWGMGGQPVRLSKGQKLMRSLHYALSPPAQP